MDELKMLKRAVIREELVAVCGDHVSALILNQFLYWQVRKRDTVKYLQEEIKRRKQGGLPVDALESVVDGWIFKKAAELKKEIMVTVSQNTIIRRIEGLVEKKLLFQRNNPLYRWDKTYQYRVNLGQLADELTALGYSLDTVFDGKFRYRKALAIFTTGKPNLQNEDTGQRGGDTDLFGEAAIPEITSPKGSVKKPKKKVDPVELQAKADSKELIKVFYDLHKIESGGQKATITGAIVSQMKRLIKLHTLKNVVLNLRKYYEFDFWFTKNGGRTFMTFVKRYDEIVTAKGEKRKVKKDSSGNFQDNYNKFMGE